ncbi:TRAP transporter small permease [Alteribacter natronophilus]|uniref:TRAP transporter small permease n=1 Tax=Alteribacter natronophilus TaxID=2583810 RepID=UPI00110E1B54|nr:TRAP transporter small permease [Alteribacter natronophilus]TMW72291.1 TRAP transporter small permease [Alteribacter natronophilus]
MKALKLVDRTLEILTILCFIGIILTVSLQITTRFLPISAVWTEELSRYLFVYAVAFGAPVAMKRQEFISIDFIFSAFPERIRHYYYAFVSVIVAATAFFIAYHGWSFIQTGQGQSSATMPVQMSWIHASISISMIFIGAYAVMNMIAYIKNKGNGGEEQL